MTDNITEVMQAVGRLRLLRQNYARATVYGTESTVAGDEEAGRMRRMDAETLADFVLKVWPDGDRPVPMAEDDMVHGSTVWCMNDYGGIFPQVVARFLGATGVMVGDPISEHMNFARIFEVYPTESAANLARRWQLLDALTGEKKQ